MEFCNCGFDWVGGPPNLYDISGSAHFINKCDNGIVIHRNRDPEVGPMDQVQVCVRKSFIILEYMIGDYDETYRNLFTLSVNIMDKVGSLAKDFILINPSDCATPVKHSKLEKLRQDDKWEHDFFSYGEPRITNCKVRAQDLHLKLQRKGLQSASQSGKSYAPNMRVLRERLTGTMTVQPTNVDPPKSKVAKPSSKNVGVEVPACQFRCPLMSCGKVIWLNSDMNAES
ncbi:unnamed protein product [Sphenostylis stenocarpa]|uniref:Uncharacterized protein n=1 Tax=Sphenostylis stenocarpa TaxID=92480 RepID=A0AA87B8X7_9FABA|nr:unnamed protein product [Sphenostylis stenocarpa]